MKKIVSLLLLMAMVFSLSACSKAAEEAAVEAGVPEEVVEQVAEEVGPTLDELAAQAAEIYYSGDYSQVFDALSQLQDSGIDLVNELLGYCSYYGIGTDIDAEAAVEMLEDLAQQGSAAAQLIIAEATSTGKGATRDLELADELYAKFIATAEAMDIDAVMAGSVFTKLADCYANGIGAETDLAKALLAVEKALENGNLSAFDSFDLAAVIDMAALDESLTVSPELLGQASALYDQAMEGITYLAENGNTIAIKLLGDYYYGALGSTQQDYTKAMEYYTQAADLGNADAMAQIGLMYQRGEGVDVSYEMAMEWNNRAALQGNAQGQAQIGYLYHMGLGVTQNLDEAGRWYTKAADQGHQWASVKLAETEITNPQSAYQALA